MCPDLQEFRPGEARIQLFLGLPVFDRYLPWNLKKMSLSYTSTTHLLTRPLTIAYHLKELLILAT